MLKILLFVILMSINCFGNEKNVTQKIDSLLNLNRNYKSKDTLKIWYLNQIANEYYQLNDDKGKEYATEALNLSKEIGFQRGIADNSNYLGIYYNNKTKNKEALENYFEALRIYEKLGLNDRAIVVVGNLGNVFADLSNYKKAREYYNQALEYYLKKDDKASVALYYGNIGNTYTHEGDFPNAIEFTKKAYQLDKKLGNLEEIGKHNQNFAVIYTYQGNYFKAIEYFDEALGIYEKLNNKNGIMNNSGNIGALYYIMCTDKDYSKKISASQKVDYLQKAIKYTHKALQISKELELMTERHGWYENLADLNKELGNWKEAYFYADSSYKVEDSVNKKENLIAIAKLEERRENELKQKENEILKKDNLLQKEASARQVVIIYSTIGGLILLLILAFVLYGRYRSKQKMNLVLMDKNQKIEQANVVIAQEKEKSEKLLLNILPIKIADRLKSGEELIADYFDEASVIFVDLAGFTKYSSKTSPSKIVNMLNHIFVEFDKISSKYGIEKIKTIGDCYMAASGIPEKNPEHAIRLAKMALEIQQFMSDFRTNEGDEIRARIGLHSGPVVAGIIGRQKFIYDLWGDTVNIASRMESSGVIGKVQCTQGFKEKVEQITINPPLTNGESAVGGFNFEERGEIEIKGKGLMKTWFLSEYL